MPGGHVPDWKRCRNRTEIRGPFQGIPGHPFPGFPVHDALRPCGRSHPTGLHLGDLRRVLPVGHRKNPPVRPAAHHRHDQAADRQIRLQGGQPAVPPLRPCGHPDRRDCRVLHGSGGLQPGEHLFGGAAGICRNLCDYNDFRA